MHHDDDSWMQEHSNQLCCFNFARFALGDWRQLKLMRGGKQRILVIWICPKPDVSSLCSISHLFCSCCYTFSNISNPITCIGYLLPNDSKPLTQFANLECQIKQCACKHDCPQSTITPLMKHIYYYSCSEEASLIHRISGFQGVVRRNLKTNLASLRAASITTITTTTTTTTQLSFESCFSKYVNNTMKAWTPLFLFISILSYKTRGNLDHTHLQNCKQILQEFSCNIISYFWWVKFWIQQRKQTWNNMIQDSKRVVEKKAPISTQHKISNATKQTWNNIVNDFKWVEKWTHFYPKTHFQSQKNHHQLNYVCVLKWLNPSKHLLQMCVKSIFPRIAFLTSFHHPEFLQLLLKFWRKKLTSTLKLTTENSQQFIISFLSLLFPHFHWSLFKGNYIWKEFLDFFFFWCSASKIVSSLIQEAKRLQNTSFWIWGKNGQRRWKHLSRERERAWK